MPVTTEVTTQYDTTTVATLNWTGTWSNATAYNPGDVAYLNGSSYVAVTANTNSAPPSANWNMLAQQGATGATGTQGPTGATGPQGATGATGATGAQGPQGTPGTNGAPGSVWYEGTGAPSAGTGINGDFYLDVATGNVYQKASGSWTLQGNIKGPQGNTGATGATGPQGATGATGPQGATGATGPTGPAGPQGTPGPTMTWRGTWNVAANYNAYDAVAYQGSSFMATTSVPPGQAPPVAPWALIAAQGATGATGATGPQGATGATGPQGATGAQGPTGATGATGPIGPAGVTGAAGPQGIQGPAGPAGAQGTPGAVGPTGPAGPTGTQGPAGPVGPQGPAGLGLNIKGSVPTYSQLPAQPQPPNDAWTAADTGHLWVSNGTQWTDAGLVRGPAGPDGATGAQGPQGPTGATGAAGPTGPQGPVGPQGAQGPAGAQGPPGDPYSVPALAIGVIVHWREPDLHHSYANLCKPAIVTEVFSLTGNVINAVVLGSSGGPVLLYDQIHTGTAPGQWHFIANCPYAMGPASAQAIAFIHTNGVVV